MVNMTSARNSVRGIIDDYGSPVTLHPVDITVDKWGDKTEIADERAIVHYKMNDDTTSTTVTDSSGRSNTGTASQNTDQFKSIANWLKLDGNVTDSSDKGVDGTFSSNTVIADCDSLTGWTNGRGDMTLNTTTFAEGTGAISFSKTDNSVTWVWGRYTTTTINIENKVVNAYVYIKDQTTLDKLVSISLGAGDEVDFDNNYGWYITPNADLTVGWNVISTDFGNLTGESGTPDYTSIEKINFSFNSVNATDVWGDGDIIIDEISYGKPLKCKNQAGTDLSALCFRGNRRWTAEGNKGSIEQVSVEGTNSDFDYTKDFSYGCWFKADYLGYASNSIGVFGITHPYTCGIQFNTNGLLSAGTRNGDGTTINEVGSLSNIVTDTWYNAFVTHNAATQELKFYVDSTLQGTVTVDNNFDTGGESWKIGQGGSYSGNEANFKGIISDARIYDRTLTATEVEAIYNSGTILTTNPADDGKINGALKFSKDDDRNIFVADINGLTNFDVGDSYSIAFWMKGTQYSTDWSISEHWETATGLNPYPWAIRGPHSSSGNISFAIYDGSVGTGGGGHNPGVGTAASGVNLIDGDWHHVIFIKDRANLRIESYIDGAFSQASTDTTTSSTKSQLEGFRVGTREGTDTYNWGNYLDDFRIYDYVLSSAEIAELYNSGSGTEDALSTNTTTTVGIPYDIMGDKFNFQTPGDLSEGDLILIVKDTEDVFVDDSERKFYITYKDVDYDVTSFEKFIVNNTTIAKQLILNKRQ